MSVIPKREPDTKQRKKLSVKLTQVHHNTLLEYTKFLDETDPAYVIEHVIAHTLATDKEFKKWQAAQV